MYPFFRSLLFRLEPETAHHLTLQLMRIGGLQPVNAILHGLYSTPHKPLHAFGLNFKNPVGLAAGYDKDALAMHGLAALGFGHIEIGTVTPRPQTGNPKPRVFRLPEDEAIINRMGFPSRGSEFVQMQLNPALRAKLLERVDARPRRRLPAILGVNLGRNKDTPNEEAVFDYLALLQNFAPYADYLTINVSSPNTAGLRRLQGRAALESLLTQLHQQRLIEQTQLKHRLPLLVKIAPDLTDEELDDAVDVILQTHMDGIIATNTTLARDGLRSNLQSESGGLSGRPLKIRSEAVLQKVVRRVNGQIAIVSVGGIMNPDDAKRRLDLGATLVQVYTGLIYNGPGLVKAIVRSL
ncbi:MAG: quinone-dependent dihydroorotate dehydrogenase [Chloroflexi bacterium]|nr:quinone-dependent dihydroorotate dehydrogenase [Chloroflexota bacterium]